MLLHTLLARRIFLAHVAADRLKERVRLRLVLKVAPDRVSL